MLIFCEFAQFVDGQMEEQHNYNYVEKGDGSVLQEEKKRKDILLDTTLRVVADVGLPAFAMKQVTQAAKTSDNLIYCHYGTRENLLLQCYLHVDGLIYEMFEKENFQETKSPEKFCENMHKLWLRYFRFMVKNDYKTLYYYEYRESKSFAAMQDKIEKRIPNCVETLTKDFGVHSEGSEISSEYFWMYMLDLSGVFAKKVIRGELKKNKDTYEMIWRLLWNGVSFPLMKGKLDAETVK